MKSIKYKRAYKCSVPCCTNVSVAGDGISYHHLPREYERRQQWITACNLTKIGVTTTVCSLHFQENDYFTGTCAFIFIVT